MYLPPFLSDVNSCSSCEYFNVRTFCGKKLSRFSRILGISAKVYSREKYFLEQPRNYVILANHEYLFFFS